MFLELCFYNTVKTVHTELFKFTQKDLRYNRIGTTKLLLIFDIIQCIMCNHFI